MSQPALPVSSPLPTPDPDRGADGPPSFGPPEGPVGGWGSVQAVTGALAAANVPLHRAPILLKQNKPEGFACVSCAWAKPAEPHPAEFCENGAKATAWELTADRTTPELLAGHTVAELLTWSDHQLEALGRLVAPMRWDAATDTYREVGWDEAFAAIGAELRALDPKSVVFYTSGRASLETSYLWQLFARLYGCNNLPDSSNMCHESTSVALPKTIGVPVGTVRLDDFDHCDAIFFFGQNVGTNSPRMLHKLQEARQRGVPIVTFNPLKERGLVSFVNPQSPLQMLTGDATVISTQYLQVRVGGDTAAIAGVAKALLALDDDAQRRGAPRVLDAAFLAGHGHGFDDFAAFARGCTWDDIERVSGLTRAALEQAAATYAGAKAVIGVYGMGLTQHREGVQNVQMVSNLLLMGGHIGRRGAGICPVRGHSNVQGQRTVGITEKPELAPLARLAELYGFEPPRDKGLDTVATCEGVLAGRVKAFLGLGGNFVRAVPDTDRIEPAWQKLRLTVQVATKLNRSHLVHGEVAYLLPCLGRIEIDRQAGGEQIVTVEDSTGCMHPSRGAAEPADARLKSEPAIVAGLAVATLGRSPAVPWDDWVADYARVRDAIERTLPETFHGFNAGLDTPGGFPRPNAARERQWKTPTGKATFVVPQAFDAAGAEAEQAQDRTPGVLRLTTLRSDDQFNTTVYGLDDRFRGIHGTRRVLLMNDADIVRLGLHDGATVTVQGALDDGRAREVRGLRVTRYDIPPGCVGGYFPECNPLVPLSHHARDSHVPAAKSVPVRVVPATNPLPAAGAGAAHAA